MIRSSTCSDAVWVVTTVAIMLGCTATKQYPVASVEKTPIVLMEIPRWSLQMAPQQEGSSRDAASVLYSGSAKPILSEELDDYLAKVEHRLVSKHHIDLSENYPDRGHIVVQLRGFEINYTQTTEELVLHQPSGRGGSDDSPRREVQKTPMRSKSRTAIVNFYESAGKGIWQLTVFDAKKPNKLADAIAKCLRKPK